MSDQTFCTNCGTPIQSTSEFCTGCGRSLKTKPKPKPFYKLWWFYVIVAAIIGFGVIGAHDGGSNQSATSNNNTPSKVSSASVPATDPKKTTTAPAATPKPAAAPKPAPAPKPTPAKPVEAKIGDIVQVGNFQVRVDSVQKASFVGDDILNKQAQGVFWAVRVDVKNNDTKARLVDQSMFQLVDANGATYEPDAEADMYANTSSNFFLNQVNPHVTTSGYVVFDMPTDAKNISMKVDSGILFATQSVDIYLGQ